MKRGYLWVDWVELGCRGWEIDESGAGLDHDGIPERCCDEDYAHLDRTTLHVFVGGCRRFVVRVMNDLRAAGLWHYASEGMQRETPAQQPWAFAPTNGTAGSGGKVETDWKVWQQDWRHPSGAVIHVAYETPGDPAPTFWQRLKAWQMAHIFEHVYKWLRLTQRVEQLRKAA